MDGSGDNEKRLVRTVSLNDSDILAVSELLGQLVNRSQPQVGEAAATGPQQTTDTDSQRIALAKAIRRARLRRTNYVSKAMLGEPAGSREPPMPCANQPASSAAASTASGSIAT